MDLARKMSRAEVRELSDDEKKERKRLQNCINGKKYYEANQEKVKEKSKEYSKKYRENNPEYNKKYREKYPEKQKERDRKYYDANKEKIAENDKKYRENNKEKVKERERKYKQTPNGKKVQTLSKWKQRGLQESDEELDIIYDLYLHQELCYSCDCILTRDGIQCATDPCMDHDHTTHKFRQICCRSCNTQDSWMQYWC
jgi:hypothetical protein